MAGVSVPVQAVQHQYLITEPIDGVSEDLPSLRDPDRRCYYKEEVGGLVMGGYEPKPIPWTPKNGIPKDFHFQLLEDNWEQFEQLLIPAIERVPALAEIGIRKMINGPEGFTPDGNFILGEAPELKGFFVSAGFNAYGIAAGGGAGKALAEWIAQGEPSMDLWPVDIRRFGAHHRDTNFLIDRALESSSKHYAMSWPYDEPETGRLLRISPLYYCLKEQRCCFGSKFGWERPNWFAPKSEEPKDTHSYGRQNWFSYVGEEHRHTREGVALFDQTSFAKFLLQGPDAEATLSWICANDVAKPTGRIIYTQLCNQHGGVEADLTVCRLAEDTYYIITGTGYANRDFNWISLHIPKGLQAKLIDVTSMYCVLALMGPQSRRVLSSIVDEDLSNEAFPFATCRDIIIAGTVARAMRITFVGELGWELHIPVESAVTAYNHLMEAGKPYGIVNAGYRAIESLRLEKGYRIWGTDVSPDYTPFEAGLGWAVKLKPQIPFLGRQSLEEKENQRLQKRLAFFAVDDSDTILLGGETIYRNGERVGWLSSGGYGYTLQQGVGMGYVSHANGVDRNYLIAGEYELEVACERVSCSLHLRPVFDPKSTRVKQ
jgi:4-methylaminobutanoate oxidase (formaldehyde-forming)